MHYFMFSEGSYSDYRPGGLYVCDHEVTEAEWDEHYKRFQAEVSEKHMAHRAKYRDRPYDDLVRDDAYLADSAAMRDWEVENSPEKTFAAKHGMVKVEYTELWRDC